MIPVCYVMLSRESLEGGLYSDLLKQQANWGTVPTALRSRG